MNNYYQEYVNWVQEHKSHLNQKNPETSFFDDQVIEMDYIMKFGHLTLVNILAALGEFPLSTEIQLMAVKENIWNIFNLININKIVVADEVLSWVLNKGESNKLFMNHLNDYMGSL